MDNQKFYVYKIYYGEEVVYIGRTNNIDNRVRQHILTGKMVNVLLISKIEIAELETESDMNLYELYYILKLKPRLNAKDTAYDELTVELEDLSFHLYVSHLYESWKKLAIEKLLKKLDSLFRKKLIKLLISTEVTDFGKEVLLTQYQLMDELLKRLEKI